MNRKVLIGAVLLVCGSSAQALTWEAGVGYETGGDELLKVTYADGGSDSITAGDGLYFNVGVSKPLNRRKTYELAGSLGWKTTEIKASNGDARLTRFPFELTLRYIMKKHRFGAGLVTDINIDLSGGGVLSSINADLQSSVGYMLQYDYSFNKRFFLAARYKALTYQVDGGEDVDAGSLGLQFTGRF